MVFSTGGGESTNPENMEALYVSVRSRGMEEEEDTPFTYWKGVDEYQDPVYPTSLSANLTAVFPEVTILLNYHVERTVILNYTNKDKNKVLGN